MSQQQNRFRVGYALSQKKIQTFILPSLISHANQNNIDLIPIDPSKPLLSQSPSFDCIIHKIYSPEWTNQLNQFSQKYPSVPIIDPPHQIEKLHSRISMLDSVTQLEISHDSGGTFGIPNQVVVFDENELMGLHENADFKFPVIAKPLAADGCVNSHDMYLVYSSVGLKKLTLPVVLQEFVNHGGVVFKVYVVGEHVECVWRKSLPDIRDGRDEVEEEEGAVLFSRVSNSACVVEESLVVMPPLEFVESLARGLRGILGLSLFNFDLIRDASDQDKYLVIDINYFPGYAKMPNFEQVLVKFLLDVASKGKGLGGASFDVKETETGNVLDGSMTV